MNKINIIFIIIYIIGLYYSGNGQKEKRYKKTLWLNEKNHYILPKSWWKKNIKKKRIIWIIGSWYPLRW